jgi:hypothetical protein
LVVGLSGAPGAPTVHVVPAPSDPYLLAAADPRVLARFRRAFHPGPVAECWLWTAGCTFDGYGKLWSPYGTLRASVLALVHAGGHRPEGRFAGHLCHDAARARARCRGGDGGPCAHRRCVNPDHLGWQTPLQNLLGLRQPGTCPRGHLLAPDNLRVSELARGRTVCLTCHRAEGCYRRRVITQAVAALGASRGDYLAQHGSGVRAALAVLAEATSRP